MFFSVVLCVNKRIPYLDSALKSIIEQNYNKKFEFLIIANNCNDDLWGYLSDNYKEDHVRLYRTYIGQLAFNLNYGANLARGEYIVRMDADDISTLDRLSKMEDYIINNQYPDVIGAFVNYIDDKGNFIKRCTLIQDNKNIRKKLPFRNQFVHPSVCIKRKSLLSVGGYLGGFQSEDYDLWLRMSRDQNFIFKNTPEVLLQYRITEGQSRGRRLPYSEVASHLLREFLLTRKLRFLLATILGIAKAFTLPSK